MTHRTYGQEISFVTLNHSGTVFKELTANHTCGRYNAVLLTKSSSNNLDGFFT